MHTAFPQAQTPITELGAQLPSDYLELSVSLEENPGRRCFLRHPGTRPQGHRGVCSLQPQ